MAEIKNYFLDEVSEDQMRFRSSNQPNEEFSMKLLRAETLGEYKSIVESFDPEIDSKLYEDLSNDEL